jgi:hypothetical protein
MQLSRAFATEPPQVRSLKLGILRDIFVQSVAPTAAAAARSYCKGAVRVDFPGGSRRAT